jgi:hypothetical protein
MAKAYFVNATPTNVKAVLNGGDQHKLAPISVGSGGAAVTSPAWGAAISANISPDGFSGDGKENELLFSSEQSGTTRKYKITSKVSTVLDLYFFMFEDSIVGEDQTGSSASITITKLATLSTSLFAKE